MGRVSGGASRSLWTAFPLLMATVLLVAPAAAGGEEEPAAGKSQENVAEPAEGCSACTGSLIKSWRIRKGDPKRPVGSNGLEKKEKETDQSNLAE